MTYAASSNTFCSFRYGYRGNDCRSNIYVLNSGEIIYFIGSVVIMYTRDTHKQKHYKEHTQEIRWSLSMLFLFFEKINLSVA